MNRKVAVLGGTGWVGRHACAAFAQCGYDVVAIARHKVPYIRSRFIQFDLAVAPTAAIAALLRAESVDVVVNATDSINTTDGWDRTDSDHFQVNVAMVERLLAATANLPWRVRVVHLGTIHEYGPVPAGTAITEAWPASPATAWARSKLAGSQAVAGSGLADGVVLRLVNLRIVNIGSGQPVAIRDLVQMLITEAGLAGVTIQHRKVHGFGGEWTQADISLADDMLGWRPKIALRDSLRDMWCA